MYSLVLLSSKLVGLSVWKEALGETKGKGNKVTIRMMRLLREWYSDEFSSDEGLQQQNSSGVIKLTEWETIRQW